MNQKLSHKWTDLAGFLPMRPKGLVLNEKKKQELINDFRSLLSDSPTESAEREPPKEIFLKKDSVGKIKELFGRRRGSGEQEEVSKDFGVLELDNEERPINLKEDKIIVEEMYEEDEMSVPGGGSSGGVISDKVTISFTKFVQLVANHSYVEVMEKNADQEVIISGNLLTDLANSHDQMNEKRMPLMFLAGLVIGIVLTYIILN